MPIDQHPPPPISTISTPTKNVLRVTMRIIRYFAGAVPSFIVIVPDLNECMVYRDRQ